MNKWDFYCSLADEFKEKYGGFENYDYEDELENSLHSSRYSGFKFFAPLDFNIKTRQEPLVKTPSGRRLNLSDINRRLRKLEFGNVHQIEAIIAWEFLMLSDIIERSC